MEYSVNDIRVLKDAIKQTDIEDKMLEELESLED